MWPRWGQRKGLTRAIRTDFLLRLVTAGFMLTRMMSAAHADNPTNPQDPQFGWREMWAGADATKDVWLLYTGVTLAPLSKDIYTDGLRLRMTGGYGQYAAKATTLQASKANCGILGGKNKTCTTLTAVQEDYDVNFSYSDMLVGYHKRFGNLTAKAFIGGSMIEHAKSARNLNAPRIGREFGVTGALEFWLNLGDNAWTSLDLNYSTAYDTAAARWRAGWRVLPTLSIGPELRVDRNDVELTSGGTCTDVQPTFRGGVFSRYEWFGGELSASTGFARIVRPGGTSVHGQRDCDDEQFEPYATINYLTQY